jgi:hypothetical protein
MQTVDDAMSSQLRSKTSSSKDAYLESGLGSSTKLEQLDEEGKDRPCQAGRSDGDQRRGTQSVRLLSDDC